MNFLHIRGRDELTYPFTHKVVLLYFFGFIFVWVPDRQFNVILELKHI